MTQENAVGAVAAKLANPVNQEPVKQVVHLFTPEGLKERQTQPVEAVKTQAAFPVNPDPEAKVAEAAPVKVDAS